MMTIRTRAALAPALVAVLAIAGGARGTDVNDTTTAALEARVRELERAVAAFEARDASWLTEQRAEEIRSLVTDVLADADTRASLLQSGVTAGWDDGFFIANADGTFRLKMNGQLQVRFVYNRQDNAPAPDDDDDRWGFENTRTKLIFSGNVAGPNWIYKIEGNFDRAGGGFGLEDAYIGHVFDDSGWIVLAGQLKVPMLREELVDSGHQLAVERSIVNEEFTAGRTQGVAVAYNQDRYHLLAAVADGHPATGGFNSPALLRDTEVSLTARAEFLVEGSWDQFADLTSWPGDAFGLLLGGAIHWQNGEFGTTDDELEVLQWTFDVSAEFGGANLFAYVVGRHLDSSTMSADQFGVVVQGGYFLVDEIELFARYEWADDDSPAEELSVITIGVNRYYEGHRVKWTTDVGIALDEVSATFGTGAIGGGADITGFRTDTVGEDGQVVIRSQIQLLF